jgi:mannose-1-phosphate guanylyltransferase/mannose-6-phosphate isomerase
MNQSFKTIPVILCGGSGTRLWPASRESRPKQFLPLMNELSLFQNTVERSLRLTGSKPEDVMIVTLGALATDIEKQFAALYPDVKAHILSEPSARNTGAAVAFAAAYAEKTFGKDCILWVLPSDHHIGDETALGSAYAHAQNAARDGKLVTFGIKPTRPDTGYGYIRAKAGTAGTVLPVERFVEKPDLETAKSYVASRQYLWNSGMFLFSANAVLREFETHAPAILAGVRASMENAADTPDAALYAQIASQPFDKAIMEKSDKVAVVPADPDWSDIGSWQSLWDIREKDDMGNVTEGRVVAVNAKNSLIQSKKTLICVAGLDNVVVVETDDAILIMDKNDTDSMRELVKKLKESGAKEVA